MSKRTRSNSRASTSSKKHHASTPRPPFQNSKELATAMLEWLPQDATLKTDDARKLLKAFDLVKAELQHRTNLMARSTVEEGRQTAVVLAGVAIPPDVFRVILSFLPHTEIVHTVSPVSKAWLGAARTPYLWSTIDNDHGLPLQNSSTVANMTQLLELLQRPQFASLRVLVPPEKVQLRAKALDHIATHCPLLETIDCGFSLWSNMKIDDKSLLTLPTLFPFLKSVRFGMYKLTDVGVESFCERMGDRLVSLHIQDSFSCRKKMSDNTMSVIARHCPNLEHFAFEFSHYFLYGSVEDNKTFSENGVITLLNGCRKLKHVSLIYVESSVGKAAFQHIAADNSISLERLYVADHEDLMHDEVLCNELHEKIDSFEVVSKNDHNCRVTEARRARRVYYETW